MNNYLQNIIRSIIPIFFFLVLFSVNINNVEAGKSVTVTMGSLPTLYWNEYVCDIWTVGCSDVWTKFLEPNASINTTYKAKIINNVTNVEIADGTTLSSGTVFRIERDSSTLSTDVSWNGTGFNADSPYGRWDTNAYSSSMCAPGDLFGYFVQADAYVHLSMNPVAPTVSVTGPVTCSGNLCTVNGSGTITASLNFPATYAKFFLERMFNGPTCVAYTVTLNNSTTQFQQNIPATSVTFNLTGAASVPLTAPSITGRTCNAAGNQVTLSWSSVSGSTGYPLLVNDTSGNCVGGISGPAPYNSCYSGTTEYLSNPTTITGTSATLNVTTGRPYSWYVHSYNASQGFGPASATNSFTCNSSYICSPAKPSNSTYYSGDDTALLSNTASVYSVSNTATKCEYTCNTGYAYSAGSCVAIPAPTVSLTVSPVSIEVGNSATLTWTVSGSVTSCTASGGWSGSKSTAGSTQGVSPTTNTTYTLTCTGPGGSTARSAGITVTNTPPTVNAGADVTIALPQTTANTSGVSASDPNTPLTYAWTRTAAPVGAPATSITSSNTLAPTFGSMSVTGTYTYRLTVTDNYGASATDSMNVIVNPAPVYSCSALPANSTYYPSDNTGLTADTASRHSITDTATKCEFICNAAYWWNNTACVLPDLIVTNGGPASGSTFSAASQITFTGAAVNSATAPITQGGWADLEIDLNADGSVNANYNANSGIQLDSFTQSQTKPLSYTMPANTLPTGSHRYRFHVDTDGTGVVESNEANNVSPWYTIQISSAPPQGNITATNCTISSGENECNSVVDWSILNPASPHIKKNGIDISTAATGNASIPIGFGDTTFSLTDTPEYKEIVVNAQCASGSVWSTVTNRCEETSCSSATLENCSLPQTDYDSTTNGMCVNGTSGVCDYTCQAWGWIKNTNTCAIPPMITQFEVCNLDGSNCVLSGGTKTVNLGTPLSVRWAASDADSCIELSGNGFSTGGATSGADEAVSVSTPAFSQEYSIVCSKGGGNTVRAVTVITNATNPSLTSSARTVPVGSDVTLTWTLNGQTGCSLTGGGLSQAITTDGSMVTKVRGYNIYKLTCDAGSATARVEIIPQGYET